MNSPAENPPDAMADLVAAAGQHLARPSLPTSVQLLPASAADRLAAGIGDVPYIFIVASVICCTGFPVGRVTMEWALALGLSLAILLFTLIEGSGRRTPGKRSMDLRVVYESGAVAARWGRWGVKYAPMIALTACCLAGVAGMLPPTDVDAGPTVAVGLLVQVLYCSFGLWTYSQFHLPPIYDRISGARVVRARHVRPAMDVRGFDVLPAAPRAVIPTGLEGSPPGGYPPSAGHE